MDHNYTHTHIYIYIYIYRVNSNECSQILLVDHCNNILCMKCSNYQHWQYAKFWVYVRQIGITDADSLPTERVLQRQLIVMVILLEFITCRIITRVQWITGSNTYNTGTIQLHKELLEASCTITKFHLNSKIFTTSNNINAKQGSAFCEQLVSMNIS